MRKTRVKYVESTTKNNTDNLQYNPIIQHDPIRTEGVAFQRNLENRAIMSA